MEKRINIAKLLKDCPSGMELDCMMYENLYFDSLNADYYGTINCYTLIDGIKTSINFSKYGTFNSHKGAKCVIFPKGKTTWEGFVPPCEFKDGDIIFTHADSLKIGLGNTWISIFEENRNAGVATYVDYCNKGKDFYTYLDDKGLLCMKEDIIQQRLATEEEKQRLFKAIEDNGYNVIAFIWNIIANDKDTKIFSALLLTISATLFVALFTANGERNTPSAKSVYEGKTTLEITYRDSIPVDTIVVLKPEYIKN